MSITKSNSASLSCALRYSTRKAIYSLLAPKLSEDVCFEAMKANFGPNDHLC